MIVIYGGDTMDDCLELHDEVIKTKVDTLFSQAEMIKSENDIDRKYDIMRENIRECVKVLNEVNNDIVLSEDYVKNLIKNLSRFSSKEPITQVMGIFTKETNKCHKLDLANTSFVKINGILIEPEFVEVFMSNSITEPRMSLIFNSSSNNLLLSESHVTEKDVDLGGKCIEHFCSVSGITIPNLRDRDFVGKLLANFDKEVLLNVIGGNFPSLLFTRLKG